MSELNGFMPHGFCISWDPVLLAMHVGADFFIALAYFSIPAGIVWALKKRKSLNFAPVYYLFAAFILACGVTHVLGIWTLWVPSYYLQGYSKVFTALISMATAIYLLPKIPSILSLPNLNDLVAINQQLNDRIKAQEHAEARLKETSEELRAALTLQNEFLVNMSHEVRTPMTGVLGCLNLLEDESLNQSQKELVDDAQASAKSLMGLLNSLLDLSKMDANEFTLNPSPVQLDQFAREATNVFRGMAREKGLDYRCVIHCEDRSAALLDEVRLRQVIQNLISNAIKFTDNGYVSVLFTSRRGENGETNVRLVVEDSGSGIPEEAREKVFERFYQVDGSTSRKGQGTGLGLPICKQLVEKMAGKLLLEEAETGGCRFVVELAFPGSDVGQEAGLQQADSEPDKPVANVESRQSGISPEALGCRILVVDDVSLNRKIIQKMLANCGFEVEIAHDGEDALQKLQTGGFHLVLMDCQMPVLDGYSTTQRIRTGAVPGLDPAIPVVALTGHATRQDRDRCIAAGMNDYLVKPAELNSFLEVITRYVRNVNAQVPARG